MAQYKVGTPNNTNNNEIKQFCAKIGVRTLLLHQGGVPNDVIGVFSLGIPPLGA